VKPRLERRVPRLMAWTAAPLCAVALAAALMDASTLAKVTSATLAPLVEEPAVPSFVVSREPFVRRVTAEGNLRAVKATPITPPRGTSGPLKIAWAVPDGGEVKKGDVVVRFAPTDFEKQLEDARSDRDKAQTRSEKEKALVESMLRERDRSAELARVELSQMRDFQSKDPEIFSKNQIIEAAIDEELSAVRTEHAALAKSIEKSLSGHKLDLIGIERKKAELLMSRAEDGLKSLAVHAPHDGIIVFETDWRGVMYQVGDTVWAGQTIANAPLLDEMEAEVFVLEADAGGLEVGKVGSLTLEAHPEAQYPVEVKRVDTLAKQRIAGSPSQYFGVTLVLSETQPKLMKPGARVHATLVLDETTKVAVPRQCVFERDGQSVVYRWQGEYFEPVAVKLGRVSPGRVAIEAGVNEGDRLALHDPTARAL
jgi:HlyD family secretion protein